VSAKAGVARGRALRRKGSCGVRYRRDLAPDESPAFRAEGEGGSIDDRDHANVDRHTELAAYNTPCCGIATGRVDFLPMITLPPR
jgi:hypothetical protein